jgi:hypothetical protein
MIAAASSTTAASAVAALAPAPTASTTWPSATTTAAARPPASTFPHWTRFIHHQRPAEKILAIAGLNGAIGFFIVAKFRKPKSARLTGKFVADYLNRIGLESGPREPILQLGFTGLVRKVAYKQFFQGCSFGPVRLRGYGSWAHNNRSRLNYSGQPARTCQTPSNHSF